MMEAASTISAFQINQKQLANMHQSFLSLVKTEGQEESSFYQLAFFFPWQDGEKDTSSKVLVHELPAQVQ